MKTSITNHRIGLVIGQLSQGGAERQITRLAVELTEQKSYTPIVFCLSNFTDPYGFELTQHGIKWFSPPNKLKFSIFKLLWLFRQVRTSQCELLYGFLNVGNIYAGAAAIALNLPFIASIRSANSVFQPVIKFLSRFFLNQANMVVGNSDSCIQILRQELFVTHERVTVIPNMIIPVSTLKDERHRLRKKWGVTTEPVIGIIALIKKSKRPSLFVSTFVAINAITPAHFVWVGDGPEKDTLKTLINSLDPQLESRIHPEGFRTNIASYLSAFDFFILTSTFEGSPNALLEAMSAGKVCVTTEVPGVLDIFIGHTTDHPIGILCESDHPDAIAQEIVKVWQNKAFTQKLGENAEKWVIECYSPETILESYHQIFSSILVHKKKRWASFSQREAK